MDRLDQTVLFHGSNNNISEALKGRFDLHSYNTPLQFHHQLTLKGHNLNISSHYLQTPHICDNILLFL